MVTSFSSVHSPPATQLYRIRKTDSTVEGIVLSPSGWLHETKRKYIILQHLECINLRYGIFWIKPLYPFLYYNLQLLKNSITIQNCLAIQ